MNDCCLALLMYMIAAKVNLYVSPRYKAEASFPSDGTFFWSGTTLLVVCNKRRAQHIIPSHSHP